jgi:peptidoglycan endopeptidase LytE
VTSRARFVIALVLSALAVQLPAVSTGADTGSYVVREGDTLSGIAGRMGVRLSDLLRANHLEVTDVIHPGQRLTVPGGGSTPSGGDSSSTYTVQAGDALYTIARRNGISLGALLAANNLTLSGVIVPGQRLTVPGGSTGGGGSPEPIAGGYTVQAGDYLGAIAADNGVSLSALLRANNLTVDSVIVPGQRLTIPGGGGGGTPTPAPRGGGSSYTVRAGDSLSVIASRHEVELSALLRANGLTVNSVIVPGQQLSLPAGATRGPIDRVIAYALAQVGKPYRFFAKGPFAFDCSGLTLAAYAQIGINLVHYSGAQARQGVAVNFWSQPIRPGDLVFLATNGATRINHVGIALNDRMWVQARRPGQPVQVNPLPPKNEILAVRRFVPAG